MALQARPASPVGVQLDSGIGRDTPKHPLCCMAQAHARGSSVGGRLFEQGWWGR
ncbi:hypothetical protein DSO57_1004739 [Entomophthora muscae]|uniref:Uncharacterized protein n=1 Tax=Entomophthora muscae TaxID=34485 RepID=A0ACC2TIU8_9FUNG|nr:hypothetical protein DSO57_1004739 [Entomophthora muscae]